MLDLGGVGSVGGKKSATYIAKSLRRRVVDLLIAATAHANRLALYTRNFDDHAGLGKLIDVVGI